MIQEVNIRATSLKEFWGKKFHKDLYLWDGAKHNLTLDEIHAITCETLPDKFASFFAIEGAMEICKDTYFKMITQIGKSLNTYHNLNLSVEFWQVSFGYWLYRHICIVYEKFAYLSDIDINHTDIILLDKESFFIPKDSIEHFELYGNDFGVHQLVSDYYYLFSKTKFKSIKRSFKALHSDKIPKLTNSKNEIKVKTPSGLKAFLVRLIKPRIVFINTYYASSYYKKLFINSLGKLFPIDLPVVNNDSPKTDIEARRTLFTFNPSNQFEQYLKSTLSYSLPTIFMEDFKKYYSSYLADIKKISFTKIVSEGWMGRNNVAIYCAIAQEMNKQLIFQEHASSCSLVERSFQWFYLSFPNMFITTGWSHIQDNAVPGGFMAKKPMKYIASNQSQILYVSQSAARYLIEFSWHPSNSTFLYTLETTRKILDLLPKSLIEVFKYRPRKDITLWDTTYTIGINSSDASIDTGTFYDSIQQSKIVVIDHLSTAITELLLMEVPFLLLINPHTEISASAKSAIDKLEKEGAVHYSPETLVPKLIDIYTDVKNWWNKNTVQEAIEEFKSIYIDKPDKTFQILNSLLKDNTTVGK